MRRLIGNWKMQGSLKLCKDFIEGLEKADNIEVTVCPPSLYAHYLIQESKNFSVGLQDLSAFTEGPHTGEIGSEMLEDLQINYTIIGHSERAEGVDLVSQKLKRCLASKIKPILCLDSLDKYYLLEGHLNKEVIIAYEPPSSIGTGLLPEMLDLKDKITLMKKSGCQVLYGGSVKADNLQELFLEARPDGFLVGGASLKLDSFNKMIRLFSSLIRAE